VILIIWAGATSPEALASKRRYVIVGCFIVGMLLTLPDIFSQTLLAVPMWLLFEAGLYFGRLLKGSSPPGES
jgi:sec-independent protein translocase protein TatC